MRIEQLMARPVLSCAPGDSLAAAAGLMWNHDCGWLAVCASEDAARVVGVITDRDICMCALFQGRPLGEIRVSEAMAAEITACRPGDSLSDAEQIMREARVRRLPVMDEQGTLVGMVSLADLAHEAAREHESARHEVTETEIGVTLAAICEPLGRRIAA